MSVFRTAIVLHLLLSLAGCASESKVGQSESAFCMNQREYRAFLEQTENAPLDQTRQKEALQNSLKGAPPQIKADAAKVSGFFDIQNPTGEQTQDYVEAYARIRVFVKKTCKFDPAPRRPS